MKFSQRLELRQSQSLVMTPQLLQAIKLLQLSSVELNEYVETELEKNPLLERANDDAGANEPSVTPAPDASPGSDTEWESKPLAPEAGRSIHGLKPNLKTYFRMICHRPAPDRMRTQTSLVFLQQLERHEWWFL